MEQYTYSYQVYSNTLYILESLEDEVKTGKWLYDDLVSLTYANERYQIKYLDFQSKSQFLGILEAIKFDVCNNLSFPIIHIEAHGDETSFEIASTAEEVTWEELNSFLSEINYACRNNVILSLGICNSHFINIDLVRYFQTGRRCPYAINISPKEKIGSNDIKYGFSNFYQSLLRERNFISAMDEMAEVTSLNILETADLMAQQIVEEVKRFIINSPNTSKQLEELMRNGKELLPGQNFNRNLKALKKHKVEFTKNELNKKWETFLMIDCFEENRSKFPEFEAIWERVNLNHHHKK